MLPLAVLMVVVVGLPVLMMLVLMVMVLMMLVVLAVVMPLTVMMTMMTMMTMPSPGTRHQHQILICQLSNTGAAFRQCYILACISGKVEKAHGKAPFISL